MKTLKTRFKIQCSFNGANDIAQCKVLKAKRVFMESGVRTLLIHLDFYNRQIAFIPLEQVLEYDEHWITRVNGKSGLFFNIDQEHFFSNLPQLLLCAE